MMQDVDYQLFFDTVENEILTDQKNIDNGRLDEVARIVRAIDLWDQEDPSIRKTYQGARSSVWRWLAPF